MAQSSRARFLNQRVTFSLSLAVVFVSSVSSYSLEVNEILDAQRNIQKRSLVSDDIELVEVCSSVQSFEQLDTAINVDLLTVEIHPDAWVFVTRCRVPGKSCRGIDENIQSICRPKKSWVQVYGRTSGDTWRPHWVAVDTACVCSIRRRRFLESTSRIPLTGKNFLP
ncbi:venom nerve growth factor 1-like [Parasteatoda tepidariorum]|uniref:venom nerve growth factor 1-like n=1 Tax=Parasteatoda tepidariorum TaxID=114398 RepID=UPI001C7226D2|nr:uncharacterized protein LOC122270890 [Parasteatoda tepidariorum]XP_042906014.1 uncharacterized protein LOC122270890 [Parasteatoda tepidariorum]XP_042906015.1 uncharacterized protein LOC122270890 [Parasteatoda tepidariorum]